MLVVLDVTVCLILDQKQNFEETSHDEISFCKAYNSMSGFWKINITPNLILNQIIIYHLYAEQLEQKSLVIEGTNKFERYLMMKYFFLE